MVEKPSYAAETKLLQYLLLVLDVHEESKVLPLEALALLQFVVPVQVLWVLVVE